MLAFDDLEKAESLQREYRKLLGRYNACPRQTTLEERKRMEEIISKLQALARAYRCGDSMGPGLIAAIKGEPAPVIDY